MELTSRRTNQDTFWCLLLFWEAALPPPPPRAPAQGGAKPLWKKKTLFPKRSPWQLMLKYPKQAQKSPEKARISSRLDREVYISSPNRSIPQISRIWTCLEGILDFIACTEINNPWRGHMSIRPFGGAQRDIHASLGKSFLFTAHVMIVNVISINFCIHISMNTSWNRIYF